MFQIVEDYSIYKDILDLTIFKSNSNVIAYCDITKVH